MPEKRIILLLDGTWNDADIGVGDTNIVRLRRIITQSLDPIPSQDQTRPQTARTFTDQTGKKREHIIFYERGVGTGGFFDNIRGGGFGAGLARNIRRAYNFLSSHYELGDQVFIFGFSRGAYTARSLVGFIAAAGLLKSDSYSPANESRAWYYYRTSPYDRPRSTWNDLASCVHDRDEFRIECLGVFETVGALGVPLRSFRRENRDLFEFHDVELSHICKINLHALAVDEHRESFQATIWRQPQMTQIATITEQTWFAGAHADIGGGYID